MAASVRVVPRLLVTRQTTGHSLRPLTTSWGRWWSVTWSSQPRRRAGPAGSSGFRLLAEGPHATVRDRLDRRLTIWLGGHSTREEPWTSTNAPANTLVSLRRCRPPTRPLQRPRG